MKPQFHDNQYRLLWKIVKTFHDNWLSGAQGFSAEPPQPIWNDGLHRLYTKMLKALDLMTSGGGGSGGGGGIGGATWLFVTQAATFRTSDFPLTHAQTWNAPTVGSFPGGVWTCTISGDYLVSGKAQTTMLIGGENYHEYILLNGAPVSKDSNNALLGFAPGDLCTDIHAARLTLAPGDTIKMEYLVSGPPLTGVTMNNGPEAEAGNLVSYFSIVRLT